MRAHGNARDPLGSPRNEMNNASPDRELSSPAFDRVYRREEIETDVMPRGTSQTVRDARERINFCVPIFRFQTDPRDWIIHLEPVSI